MRKIFLCFMVVMLFATGASAMTTMNEQEIKRAQNYGIMNYQNNIPDFIKPWTAFEEKSDDSLVSTANRAYVYSPFYLVAINARERLLASQTINIADGEVVLQTFQNSLPFGVLLYMEDAVDADKNLSAVLLQNGKKIESYAKRIQEVSVVKTKVITETITVESDAEPAVKSDDEGVIKPEEQIKKDEQSKQEVKNGKIVKTIEVNKTVPALHRVQMFFYFDLRTINPHAPATLILEAADGHKYTFNFYLGKID